MKKLNNKGWGMATFLIILGLLFFTLLLIAYLSNQYGGGLPSSSRGTNSYHLVELIKK